MAGDCGRGRGRGRGWFGCVIALCLTLWLVPVAGAAAQAAKGVVSGRVTFAGTIPAAQPIDMSSEAYCAQAESGRGMRSLLYPVRVGPQDGLHDVVVQVKGVPAQASKAVPTEPVVLDQFGCHYRPEVLALRVGQPLTIRNSDNVLHNVNVMSKVNRAFNIGQPTAGLQSQRTFRAAEADIPVHCDIHDWMRARITLFDHSFFAITESDGSFTIDGLPPGEYELEARHHTLGSRTQRIRVGADRATAVAIVFGSS